MSRLQSWVILAQHSTFSMSHSRETILSRQPKKERGSHVLLPLMGLRRVQSETRGLTAVPRREHGRRPTEQNQWTDSLIDQVSNRHRWEVEVRFQLDVPGTPWALWAIANERERQRLPQTLKMCLTREVACADPESNILLWRCAFGLRCVC